MEASQWWDQFGGQTPSYPVLLRLRSFLGRSTFNTGLNCKPATEHDSGDVGLSHVVLIKI